MAKFDIDFLDEFSEAKLIEELQRIASLLGKDTLTRRDVDEHGRMSSAVVIKRFGSLRRGLQVAGLRPQRFMKASNDELLDLLEELWVATIEKFGRRPERADLKGFGFPVSGDTIVRRFGSWRKALIVAAERADSQRPTSDDEAPKATAPQSASPRPTRESLSVRKRFLILKRDNYQCQLCKNSGVPLEVDHLIPFARGGTDDFANLQTLCVPCNRGKRDSLQ